MRSVLKSNVQLLNVNNSDVCVLSWICPFCNNTKNPIISSDPYCKSSSFHIHCDGCFDRGAPSCIGIKILGETAFKGPNLGELDGFYVYSIQILKCMNDSGEPKYTFRPDECHNKTFITDDGTEFKFD